MTKPPLMLNSIVKSALWQATTRRALIGSDNIDPVSDEIVGFCYNAPMLTPEEKTLLQGFVARNSPGVPYWRRVNIILMSDDGIAPEVIAVNLGSSIVQTRKWINVFRQQGIKVFPDGVLRAPALFLPDDHVAEAGRAFLRQQLAIIEQYQVALIEEGAPEAVHETRKAIRRLRVAFSLLAPYFESNLFEKYRRRFRKMLRGLGPARDSFVALAKLDALIEQDDAPAETRASLKELRKIWQIRLAETTALASELAQQPGYQKTLAKFNELVTSTGAGVADPGDKLMPVKMRHLAPVMIAERLAQVLAYDELVSDAAPAQLHGLRIQFKYFRYTLDFLTPILSNDILTLTAELNNIQDHLGDLQDAYVAQTVLSQMPADVGLATGINVYRQAKREEIDRLVTTFAPVWQQFDNVQWRQTLRASMMHL